MPSEPVLRLVCWNINRQDEAWRLLGESDFDVALLQEARQPPAELESRVRVGTQPWSTAGAGVDRPWRAVVGGLSDRVELQPLKLAPIETARGGELAVSRMGTLAVSKVTIRASGEVVTVASMYGAWEWPLPPNRRNWKYADASTHRLISDLSVLIQRQTGLKILAAGDLNILHGYGERGNSYWGGRYGTVFNRMEAIGLKYVGPRAPDGGQQASPWPEELPADSLDVPTYRVRPKDPRTATRQLDFVFATEALAKRLRVRALNREDEWGPSDHCRVVIELAAE